MAADVSIIVPTHNRGSLLMETLASVLAQTHRDFECVIVDDHSTDDTSARLAPLLASDGRFRLIELGDAQRGAQAARNAGISASTGAYVMLLDSDDLIAPFCLARRLTAAEQNRAVDFIVFPCECFRTKPGDVALLWNTHTGEDDLDRFLKLDVPWQTTSPFWKRAALIALLPWPESVPVGQDWEFHIRALATGCTYARAGVVDHYWRMADADRNSIGKNTFRPELLRGRVGVNEHVVGVVRAAGKMTDLRRRALAGVFFQSAERIAQRVSRVEGRAVWKKAHALKLITVTQRVEGDLYLFSGRWPSVREVLGKLLRKRWPAEYFLVKSPTYLKAPVPAAAGRAA